MKKEYINPEIQVQSMEAVVMAADSLSVSESSKSLDDAKGNEGGSVWDED